MRNKKKLKNEMAILYGMKEIIGAYEEIAAMRMRKVKKSVLQNREFVNGLNNLYSRVWYTYLHESRRSTLGFGKKEPDKLLTGNGKTISILVTANTGLYGDIIKNTFNLFLKDITGSTSDLLVMGRLGKRFMQENGLGDKFKYFDLDDNNVDREKLEDVIQYILQYTNVIVYHGLYVSVLTQSASKTFVTGKILDLKEGMPGAELTCLIEPTAEEVTIFFEKQILASVFEQSMFEASLSKFASRMISLDLANENIQEYIKDGKFQMLKIRHALNNLKQTERISGIALWS